MTHHEAAIVKRLELRKLTVHNHALMKRGTGFTTSCDSGFDKHNVIGSMKVQRFDLEIWPNYPLVENLTLSRAQDK